MLHEVINCGDDGGEGEGGEGEGGERGELGCGDDDGEGEGGERRRCGMKEHAALSDCRAGANDGDLRNGIMEGGGGSNHR
jgi:hypothetical protein